MKFFKQIIFTFLYFIILCGADLSSYSADIHKEERLKSQVKPNEKIYHEVSEAKIYERLLFTKRKEQTYVIKSLIEVEDLKKQNSALKVFFQGFKKVLIEGKVAIDASKIQIEKHSMPTDEKLRDQTARIIENVAFLAEFTLYFPKFVEKLFNKDNNFKELYKWSFFFAKKLSFFDKLTDEMLDLAAQELLLIPRSDNFVNPYYKELSKDDLTRAAIKKYEEENEFKKKMKKLDAKLKKKKVSERLHNEL